MDGVLDAPAAADPVEDTHAGNHQEQEAICCLAVSMCQAPSPAAALMQAAVLLSSRLPGTCHVSLALLSQDAQQLRYHKLCAGPDATATAGPGGVGGGGLGSRPSDNTAAGLAAELKQVVRIGDIHNGDLGLQDWQHLAQEHSARAFVAAPLVMAQTAVGALVLASLQAQAFDGREPFIQAVTALVSPYTGLLRCNQELQAVESFMQQMLPPRVAIALQQQQQLQQQQAPGGPSSILQQLHMAGVHPAAPGRMPMPPASLLPSGRAMSRSSSSGRSGSSNSSGSFGPSWGTMHVRMGQLLDFQQPRAEMAYRVAAHQRWQCYLDVALVCLTVLSVLGPQLHARSSGSRLADTVGLLLGELLACCACHQAVKLQSYVWLREPLIALQRLLRVAAYVLELQLSLHPTGMAPAVLGLAILLWQGTVAQVRLRMHVPLQAFCSVVVVLATVQHGWHSRGSSVSWSGEAPLQLGVMAALQLLLGFALPTLLIYVVERHTRLAFLRSLERS